LIWFVLFVGLPETGQNQMNQINQTNKTNQSHKEPLMQISVRWFFALLALGWSVASVGCETVEQHRRPAWSPVSITEISSVAGKWEGILRRLPPTKRNDLVTIVIAPDGKFHFVSVRTIGVMSGEGNFDLTNGKLTASSERGTIEATLFEAEGQRMLKAVGKAADGMEYNAEMTQAK